MMILMWPTGLDQTALKISAPPPSYWAWCICPCFYLEQLFQRVVQLVCWCDPGITTYQCLDMHSKGR